jgi:glycosyltransferase involved in cell wall biosynthesis
MNNSLVSLIIPAFNEDQTIGKVIQGTVKTMDAYGLPYEIIVVDDCSTDNTKNVASLYKEYATVLSNASNRGKGYCIRRGAQYARGDVLVTLDSDGEHKPEYIPTLLSPLFTGTDIVTGSRFSGNSRKITTRLHHLGNILFNVLIFLLTGEKVSDSQTGFRALKRNVYESLHLTSDGFDIEMEITIKSLMNGFSFKEVPISVERRKYSTSRIKVLSDGKKILSTLIRSSLLSNEHYSINMLEKKELLVLPNKPLIIND